MFAKSDFDLRLYAPIKTVITPMPIKLKLSFAGILMLKTPIKVRVVPVRNISAPMVSKMW